MLAPAVRPARRSYRLAGALTTARLAHALTAARRRRGHGRGAHGEALGAHVARVVRDVVVRVAYAPAPAEELDLVRVRVRVKGWG